jgi:phospholipid-binding lipoprotein MlaA
MTGGVHEKKVPGRGGTAGGSGVLRSRDARRQRNSYVIAVLLAVCFLFPLGAHADDSTAEGKAAVAVAPDGPVATQAADSAVTSGEAVKEPASNARDGEAAVAEEAGPPPEEAAEEKPLPDPLEPVNRFFFTFNDRFYFWVMKPASKVYGTVVPEWGRVRVRNVFHNVAMPIRFVSALLQLKIRSAAFELGSFMVNSTWGLGGMFDIVKKPPDIQTDEDMGLAFGHYGVGEGFYIVWPFVGPSDLRDTVGLAADSFLYPVNYITPLGDLVAVRGYEQLNKTSLRIGEYEDLKASALDPYIAVRDAYKQYRRNRIKEQ